VYDGRVQLPKTLGTIPASATGQRVSITVTGFTTDVAEEVTDCARQTQVSSENARILRRSIQTYSPDKILFVPMPLKYACYDVDCSASGSDSTCKAGRCVDANVPVESLVEYDDKLVFGDSATCFRALRDTVNGAEVAGCVDPASPVETVNDVKCIYKLPDAAPGTGLNVVAVYDGGFLEEILDMGRSARRRHRALLTQLVAHLLKLEHSPATEPRRHWLSEAATFRIDAKREAADAPSINGRIDFMDLFQDARRIAIDGMRVDGVDGREIPSACPYDLDTQILADGWFPENRHTFIEDRCVFG
jgi:hypothetical protein